jgi:excisionase family DNA binding protein
VELYLSVGDASRILGITPQTVRLMIRQHTLPVAAKTVGGIQLFRQEDVDHLAAERARRSERSPAGVDRRAP